MTSIKTLILGISAASLAMGGSAFAQQADASAQMHRPGAGADHDRTITRSEAEATAAKRFARMDANGDGKIDSADREMRQQQHRERMFAKLDTDGNGSISKAEFTTVHGPRGDRKNGGMSARSGGMHKGMHRGMHRGMAMMKGADTNGDKAISQAEFTASAARRFDAQDTNHDGKVTPEERKAARTAFMEERRAKWQARAAASAGKSATN